MLHLKQLCTYEMYCFPSPSVTLCLVNEQTCSGDDLTFSCLVTGPEIPTWTFIGLPGYTGGSNAFGFNLNAEVPRISSPDSSLVSNPSSITIVNVMAVDSGAVVRCSTISTPRSSTEEIILSIRKCRIDTYIMPCAPSCPIATEIISSIHNIIKKNSPWK